MVNVISTASELGYLNIPDNTLIDLERMKNYPDEQMVLITTGSQGESMAALSEWPPTCTRNDDQAGGYRNLQFQSHSRK